MALTDLLRPDKRQQFLATSRAIVAEVAGNVMTHGGVVAGNFAYLALLSIFPFFIVAAALGGVFGRSEYGAEAVQGFLAAVPPSVASVLAAAEDVVAAADVLRHGAPAGDGRGRLREQAPMPESGFEAALRAPQPDGGEQC